MGLRYVRSLHCKTTKMGAARSSNFHQPQLLDACRRRRFRLSATTQCGGFAHAGTGEIQSPPPRHGAVDVRRRRCSPISASGGSGLEVVGNFMMLSPHRAEARSPALRSYSHFSPPRRGGLLPLRAACSTPPPRGGSFHTPGGASARLHSSPPRHGGLAPVPALYPATARRFVFVASVLWYCSPPQRGRRVPARSMLTPARASTLVFASVFLYCSPPRRGGLVP